MPKKSRKHRTRKQKIINMVGCSKKHKHSKSCKKKDLGNNACPNCGPNCHCGPNCNCPHPCPGSCYLNRRLTKKTKKYRGGSGCGSCSCPIGGLTFGQMKQFGGELKPVLMDDRSNTNFVKIPGVGQNGGTCAACSGLNQNGGSFFKPASPIPGPFIGSSWGAPVDKWPGTNGIGGDRNYLDSISGVITNDPATQMSMSDSGYKNINSMVGGNKRRKNKSIRGGGLIPQDLVNLGSSFSFNMKSAYNSLNGYKAPVNPLPYKDQLTRQ